MAESEVNDDRTSVRTYVPAYQRDAWDEHADELDMSRSEFVRTMVQAGRRGFLDESESDSEPESIEDVSNSDRGVQTPGSDLEDQVIRALSDSEFLSWDELLEAVIDEIEEQLETTLQELQASGNVRYSGRNGGYTLDE